MSDIVSSWIPYHCSNDCQQAGCPGHEMRMAMADPCHYHFEVSKGDGAGGFTLDRNFWEGMVKAHASAWEKAGLAVPAEETVTVELKATFDTPELRAQAAEYAASLQNGVLELLGHDAAPPPLVLEDFMDALCKGFGLPKSVLFAPVADKSADMEAYYKQVNEPLEVYYKQLEDLVLREEGALHLPHVVRKEEEPRVPRVVRKEDEITPEQQAVLDADGPPKAALTEEEAQKALAKIDSLHLCGCGTDGAWAVLWWLLEMAEDHDGCGSYYDATRGDLRGVLAVGPGASAAGEARVRPGPAAEDWVQFGAKVIDAWGLTAHGTGIGWAWAEDDGRLLLRFFRQHGCDPDAWPERWWFYHECPLCRAEAEKARRANAWVNTSGGFLSVGSTERCSRHKETVCVSRRATDDDEGPARVSVRNI